MCRTRQPKSPSIMMAKRRPRYSAEEKKLIAKAKAKKRRDEETKYFNTMESLIKGNFSPFVDLPEKKILSVTLRLANVWKISYFILNRHIESPFESQGKLLPKQSVLRDISDCILLITHRFRDSDQGGPFIILYVTSSVQQYLHISNSHELFGAKFDDYCSQGEDGSYIDMRAPLSQKEKRTYPSVRCKVIQCHFQSVSDRHEMRFYLLQAPQTNRGSKPNAEKCETAVKITKDDFSKYSPQYWRAMQTRRRAVRRGAPKSIIIPEQLRHSRYQGRQSETLNSTSAASQLLRAANEAQNASFSDVSPVHHRNLVELSKLLTEDGSLPYSNHVYLSPPENKGSGVSTPRFSALQDTGSEVVTPVGYSPCVSSSISPVPQLNSSLESTAEGEIHPSETIQFLTDLGTTEFGLPELARTIDPNDPIELPDSSSLYNTSLSDITPTIGIDGAQGAMTDQFKKLSMSDIESSENLAMENDSSISLSSMLTSSDVKLPKMEPTEFIKQEVNTFSAGESDIVNPEPEKVTFTADCQGDDISHLQNFLVHSTSPSYPSHKTEPTECLKGQSDWSLLRRSNFSQNLIEMESKESMEKMELGSSSDSLGLSKTSMKNKPASLKPSFSSGESLNAPRYIGDLRMATQLSLESSNSSSKMILCQSDFEMKGTPPNSFGQDLSNLAVRKSSTSTSEGQCCSKSFTSANSNSQR